MTGYYLSWGGAIQRIETLVCKCLDLEIGDRFLGGVGGNKGGGVMCLNFKMEVDIRTCKHHCQTMLIKRKNKNKTEVFPLNNVHFPVGNFIN